MFLDFVDHYLVGKKFDFFDFDVFGKYREICVIEYIKTLSNENIGIYKNVFHFAKYIIIAGRMACVLHQIDK